MLKNNSYYYEDCWTYFWFANVYSKDYNLFITNKNDLTIENTIGASTSFESAAFQDGNYYTGTKKTQKTFKRKCAAEGLTLSRYKEMMSWLEHGTRGMLFFDYDPWWGWLVVLDTVGDAKIIPTGDTLIVEFDLTFKTIGTYLAKNHYDAYYDSTTTDTNVATASTNQYHIPTITLSRTLKASKVKQLDFYVQGINNHKQEIVINQDIEDIQATDISVQLNDTEYLNVKIQTPTNSADRDPTLSYDSKLNFLFCDNNLIENNSYYRESTQKSGVLNINSVEPIKIIPRTITKSDNYIYITITSELCNKIIAKLDRDRLFVCNSQPKDDLSSNYNYGAQYYYNPVNCFTRITHDVTINTVNNTIKIPQAAFSNSYYDNWYIGVYNKITVLYENPQTIDDITATVKSYNNL